MEKLLLKYLIFKRIFIFADEWSSYFILIYIYKNFNARIFYICCFLAFLFNSNTYLDYWRLCSLYEYKKFNLLKNKNYVLDLGSSPGGWSQVLTEKIIHGKIISVDLIPMKKIKNCTFIQGDFLKTNKNLARFLLD